MKKIMIAALFASHSAFAATPERVVSLSLASDEIVVELLSKCAKLDKLLAVSTLADDPSLSYISDGVAKIPNRVHSEPESLLKLKPDLVIAATFNRPELLALLKKKNIPLVTLSRFSSHTDIEENIHTIGKAVGCEKQAGEIAKSFISKIAAIRERHANDKLETAVSWSSDQTVMAADTLFDDLLQINHLENAAAKAGLKHWPRITPEALRQWNPDWIVIACEPQKCKSIQDNILTNAAWKELTAVKKKNFIAVEPRAISNTSQFFGVDLNRSIKGPK